MFNWPLARAHRIGRFSENKNRPIIAKLFNEKEVESVMSKGFKLKNTDFSISRDYSQIVREKRRQLLRFAKSEKKEGDKVRLVFDKLFINSVPYVWDNAASCAVRVSDQ